VEAERRPVPSTATTVLFDAVSAHKLGAPALRTVPLNQDGREIREACLTQG
jgi:hypothetical protein